MNSDIFIEVETGEIITLPPTTWTNELHDLSCFNSNPTGTGTRHDIGENVGITSDQNLYGIWDETDRLSWLKFMKKTSSETETAPIIATVNNEKFILKIC